MLEYTASVRDESVNVVVPVAKQITRYVLDELGLTDTFNKKVYLNTPFMRASASSEDGGMVQVKETRMTANVTYNKNSSNLPWPTASYSFERTAVHPTQNKVPIFHDTDVSTSIFELSEVMSMDFEFHMDFVDRVEADEAMSRLTKKFGNEYMFTIEDIAYEYELPRGIYSILFALFKLKGGATASFQEYMQLLSNRRITFNVNRNDPDGPVQPVVKRAIGQVLCQASFSASSPEPDSSGTSVDLYRLSFGLQTQFASIPNMQIQYPVTAKNNILPREFVFDGTDDYHRAPKVGHPYFYSAGYEEMVSTASNATREVVHFPGYDTWTPPRNSALRQLEYDEFYTVLMTLDTEPDPEDPDQVVAIDTVIDLANDLPFPLASEVLESIRVSGVDALEFMSPICVAVYANDVPLNETMLELNDLTLTIKTKNLYPVYRIVFGTYKGPNNGNIQRHWVAIFDIIANRTS